MANARTIKRAAQAKAQYAIKLGRLRPEPCEVCGAERVEAHHDDYSQPLAVRWLCRRHHSEAHRELITATRARGERSGSAKLTDQQVAEIRQRYRAVHPARSTGCSSSELAAEYGVTKQYIWQLATRKWRTDG